MQQQHTRSTRQWDNRRSDWTRSFKDLLQLWLQVLRYGECLVLFIGHFSPPFRPLKKLSSLCIHTHTHTHTLAVKYYTKATFLILPLHKVFQHSGYCQPTPIDEEGKVRWKSLFYKFKIYLEIYTKAQICVLFKWLHAQKSFQQNAEDIKNINIWKKTKWNKYYFCPSKHLKGHWGPRVSHFFPSGTNQVIGYPTSDTFSPQEHNEWKIILTGVWEN